MQFEKWNFQIHYKGEWVVSCASLWAKIISRRRIKSPGGEDVESYEYK